ncbi:hypothetical protein IT411_01610 [Candidatus Peregrinibacteria bacterium]|nr:hypothetical protein [Candidatus Peregrinibacteria bacterium]
MTNFSRKLEELAEKAGTDPAKTVVSVDIANVWSWTRGTPANDNVRADRNVRDSDVPPSDSDRNSQRVSMEMLADFFEGEELVQEVRIFAPKVFLNQEDLRKLTNWAERNVPHLLDQIRDLDTNSQGYMNALARIFISLLRGKSLAQVFEPEIAAYVKILLRLERTNSRMQAFKGVAKAKYLTRTAVGRIKPLRLNSDHAKEAEEIAKNAEIIASEAATASALDLGNLNASEIVRNVEKAQDILERLSSNYPDPNFDKLAVRMKDLLRAAKQLSSSLESRSKVVSRMADIHNLQQESADKILRALDAPGNYTKCDVDPYINVKSLSRQTLARFNNHVFLTGDGDFKYLYDELRENGVGVMVVSPGQHLSRVLKEISAPDIVTYDPSGENIWKK